MRMDDFSIFNYIHLIFFSLNIYAVITVQCYLASEIYLAVSI